jgi:hypothetical protein
MLTVSIFAAAIAGVVLIAFLLLNGEKGRVRAWRDQTRDAIRLRRLHGGGPEAEDPVKLAREKAEREALETKLDEERARAALAEAE